MAYISQTSGYLLLAIYGILMILITWFFARWKKYKTISGFLVAERNVSWWLGASSIAASWIWAPALFVSVQVAFEKGLPGVFWFTFPNIIALLIYIKFAPRIREKLPNGYTLPQWIRFKLKSERVHRMYLFPYFFYQLMAVTVQLFAGGSLLYLLTGIPLVKGMIIMSVIVLTYSYISGLEASIVTDFIQFISIIVGVLIVVPLAVIYSGGWHSVIAGIGGVSGRFTNIFDSGVAFSFGIVTAIGLISGAISDQQYWQRAFAIKKKNLVPSFLFGAIMFGIVPIVLSLLGFIAANPASGISLPIGVDTSMIGVFTVSTLLPVSVIVIYVIMLLGALFSTLDSGIMAASSLFVRDVLKYSDKEEEVWVKIDNKNDLSEEEVEVSNKLNIKGVFYSRVAMFGIVALGFLVALAAAFIPGFGLQQLWWIFNTIAACVVVPTVLRKEFH